MLFSSIFPKAQAFFKGAFIRQLHGLYLRCLFAVIFTAAWFQNQNARQVKKPASLKNLKPKSLTTTDTDSAYKLLVV